MPLPLGSHVYAKPRPSQRGSPWIYGQIINSTAPRSYSIDTGNSVLRCNRTQLHPPAPPEHTPMQPPPLPLMWPSVPAPPECLPAQQQPAVPPQLNRPTTATAVATGPTVESDYLCPSSSRDLPEKILTVHRSCIRTELIEHFKDPIVMTCNIDFKVINEKREKGVGVGVICEVYTLFWSEFSISMTIGEREKGFPLLDMITLLRSGRLWGEFELKGLCLSPIFPPFCQRLSYATASLATKFQIPCLLIHLQSTYPQ